MSAAKIRLSPPEMELLVNKEWILTKNRVLGKTEELLGLLLQRQQDYLQQNPELLPAAVSVYGAKLSRGENYLGLPYRILDHPRCFEKDGYFAVRSFCWWGNFFSVTLLLSGKYKALYEQGLYAQYEELQQRDFYSCIVDDPWQHHFEPDNVMPLRALSSAAWQETQRNRVFLKLAKKIPLTEWDHALDQMQELFVLLLRAADQLPSR